MFVFCPYSGVHETGGGPHGISPRADDQERSWDDGGPWHGHAANKGTVAGYKLPDGFHWDVSANEVRVETPFAVAMIHEYANIYPNGELRIEPPFAKWLSMPALVPLSSCELATPLGRFGVEAFQSWILRSPLTPSENPTHCYTRSCGRTEEE
jgi:hypothetical protein